MISCRVISSCVSRREAREFVSILSWKGMGGAYDKKGMVEVGDKREREILNHSHQRLCHQRGRFVAMEHGA
jgi:hypothetical protein